MYQIFPPNSHTRARGRPRNRVHAPASAGPPRTSAAPHRIQAEHVRRRLAIRRRWRAAGRKRRIPYTTR